MTGRVILWFAGTLMAIAVAWLWPRFDRPPTDFEIGLAFLRDHRPELARLFFDDTRWRGVAAYRAGRYAQASRDFASDDTVESLYNLGNAYAQLRDWENAAATYGRVLRFDPEHADAKYNLALVRQASEPPMGQPVAMDAPPEQLPPESAEPQSAIPQESTPQSTQARESEQSDTAGNTSDTDEAGETDTKNPAKPENSTGETGSAGAVGVASEEEDRDKSRIVGTVDLKQRSSARPAEILLREIRDDPKKVLRARLMAAYETRLGGVRQ
ncbi:MAG: tetratricopeptide repeat protein [Gammaproteobacteria bacterium]|nr:tetratricopeptide repeat protein [Gammaproteobacteria bacterium]